MHEAACHEENAFVTLTVDDAHLPPDGSLDRAAFPGFMKRLRARVAPRRVRFFHAGEYGETYGRPHYHACLFGWWPPDAEFARMRGEHRVYRSALLAELWPDGFNEVGSVTFESAAYVARYMVKKSGQQVRDELLALDGDTGECWPVEPEYSTMSRRPGIGRPWLERFGEEVFRDDGVVVRGRLSKPPRYYDQWFEVVDPARMEAVCLKRQRDGCRPGEGSRERLAVREAVAKGAAAKRREPE